MAAMKEISQNIKKTNPLLEESNHKDNKSTYFSGCLWFSLITRIA